MLLTYCRGCILKNIKRGGVATFLSFFGWLVRILYQKTVGHVMNKKTKLFAIVSLVCILLGGFAGCKNINTTLEDTVSEIHEKVLYAGDDNFFVEVVSGMIEKNCTLDGVKNEMQNFVSIKIVATQGYQQVYADFSMQNAKYSQPLEQSPVDDKTWSVTICEQVLTEDFALSVLADDNKFDYQLSKVQTGDKKPVDILKQTFEKELMDCFDGKIFDCETTVRLVKSPDKNDQRYFWYVVVYKPDKTFFGLMADAVTGEVVAKKA